MQINIIASLNGAPIALAYDSSSVITIGRELGNTISPMALDGVSRSHAKIYFKDGSWYVEDLGSSNGTFLAGKKIDAPAKLNVDDRLQFGPFEVCIHRLGDGNDAAPAAAPAPAAAAAPAPAAAPQPTVSLKPVSAGIRKPLVGGAAVKPGLKLPPKPGLAAGLKLPPRPGIAPGLKLPPKTGAAPAVNPPKADSSAQVEMTPVE